MSTYLEARGMDWDIEAKGDEVVVGLRLRDFWVTVLDLDTKFLEPAINADLQNDAISDLKILHKTKLSFFSLEWESKGEEENTSERERQVNRALNPTTETASFLEFRRSSTNLPSDF